MIIIILLLTFVMDIFQYFLINTNGIIFLFLVTEAVPGNIRNCEHFVSFMRRLVDYIKLRLRVSHVVQEYPAEFLRDIRIQASIDRKPLR